MRKAIHKIAVISLLAMIIIFYPAGGLAAELNFNISVVRQDGATCGEIWFDNVLVWRLMLLPDGARPVVRNSNSPTTTLIIPDIVNGMFVIKME